jgi:MFS family permease
MNKKSTSSFNSIEKKAAISLSAVFALRMLGLFMLLPVFSVIGQTLDGYTPVLIGFAMGAYGLTQAIFQIPFGWMSDAFGRKRMILIGLGLFLIGNLVAALSDHIVGVIIGRLLQGCGAIASSIMALASDLSRDEQRTKMMASIGMSIGAAFAIAMILGPLITEWLGLSGVFYSISFLALIAMMIILWATPTPQKQYIQRDAIANRQQFTRILSDPQLIRLNVSIFSLHFLLTSFFVVFPHRLADLGIPLIEQSGWYLLTMVVAVLLMIPLIIYAERNREHAKMMFLSVLLIAGIQLAFGLFLFPLFLVIVGLIVYFAGFNLMEALLPSMISRIAPLSGKGTALGVYSTSQFIGAFLGGPLAGWMIEIAGRDGVYLMGAGVALLWALTLKGLNNPSPLTAYTLTMPDMGDDVFPQLVEEIKMIQGVAEAIAIPEAGAVYLKLDQRHFNPDDLKKYRKNTIKNSL